MSYGGTLVPRDSRSCRFGVFGSLTAWVPTMCRTTAPTATTGAVNLPGNSAPAVNPTTQMVTSATRPTATGQGGELPGPGRAGGRAEQVPGLPAPLAGPGPGAEPAGERREIDQQPVGDGQGADGPDRGVPAGRPVGVDVDQHGQQRQHPQHRVALDLDPEQAPGGGQCADPGRGP